MWAHLAQGIRGKISSAVLTSVKYHEASWNVPELAARSHQYIIQKRLFARRGTESYGNYSTLDGHVIGSRHRHIANFTPSLYYCGYVV
jgi:hypothetical protein